MKYRRTVLLVIIFIGFSGLRGVNGWTDSVATGGAAVAPSVWVNTSALDFGPVPIGQSGWWYFTFKNIGNAPLNLITDAAWQAPFSGTQPACATNLLPDDICSYIVFFEPTETGSFSNTFQFETNAGLMTLQLNGEGTVPHFYVNPLAFDFGSVLVDNGQTQSTTLYNTSGYHLDLTTSSPPSPEFGSSSGDCAGGIPPNDSCTVYLNFQPTQAGTFSDTYTINSAAGSMAIPLQGRGRVVPFLFGPHQQITPQALDFGPVPLGESQTLTVTITNQSFDTDLTNWVGGGVAAPYSATQDCASGVPPGETCQFLYTFTPTAAGVFSATSTVANSAGTIDIDLRGEGVAPKPHLHERVLEFGPLQTLSNHETTLNNSGHTHLYLTNVTVSNPAVFTPSWGCVSGLPPYLPLTFCSISYDFSVTEPGLLTESSTITTDGGDIIVTLKAGAQPPIFEQQFVPDQIPAEGVTTLQYRITNPNEATTFYFVAFSHTWAAGLDYADPVSFNVSPECGTPQLIPVAGNPPTVTMSQGTILGGDSCLISVNVTAVEEDDYLNPSGFVEAGADPNDDAWLLDGNAAAATLHVGTILLYLPALSN